MNLPTLTPRDFTESRVVFDRQPHEQALDHRLRPITETEWLQLMARQLGLPEHRPAAAIIPMLEKRK